MFKRAFKTISTRYAMCYYVHRILNSMINFLAWD